jgi:hypothetical protein
VQISYIFNDERDSAQIQFLCSRLLDQWPAQRLSLAKDFTRGLLASDVPLPAVLQLLLRLLREPCSHATSMVSGSMGQALREACVVCAPVFAAFYALSQISVWIVQTFGWNQSLSAEIL